MQTMTELAIERARRGGFTRREAACWIDGDGSRLDALLKRAVGHGELWRIRRGLYCLHTRYLRRPLDPFAMAQLVHGPSYISMESALSYHDCIPEAVHTITSASVARSRTFNTPLGVFSFTRVPQTPFYVGVRRVATDDGGSFLLAEPLKALADYVYVHHCEWTSAAPVIEGLRVEEEALAAVKAETFDLLMGHCPAGRVRRFLAGLRKDLDR
jgi:hypothetical protein